MSEQKYYYECRQFDCGKEFMLGENEQEVCPFCHSTDIGPVEEPEVKP